MQPGDGSARHAPVLITGGAGFIGSNLAARLLADGRKVIVYDNLSRSGAARNLDWLSGVAQGRLDVRLDDTRDAGALRKAVQCAGCVFHLAAQTTVASSLEDPVTDFEVNVRGTLNLLEVVRRASHRPALIFASTSKVYGTLPEIALRATASRYQPEDPEIRLFGISEAHPLAFCSPHGCAKGAADQYVLDYARNFGIAAMVLRIGCVYGPRQCGCGDHGWVTHFLLQALRGKSITIHGDGMQVRDILHVDDVVESMRMCGGVGDDLRGRAFNIGGGTANTASPGELLETIRHLRGHAPHVRHADWRVADQRYFVSDTRKFRAVTGWRPRIGSAQGIAALHRWLTCDAAEQREHEVAQCGATAVAMS